MGDYIKQNYDALGENLMKERLSRWQRFKYRFLRWWLFNFRNKTIWEGEIGGFKYRFRRFWIDIRSIAPNHWNLRLGIANNAYGLLLSRINALQKYESECDGEKAKDERLFISSFSLYIYQTSAYLPSDSKFARGLKKELDWAYNRLIRKAKEEADKVTDEQNAADEALLQSVTAEAGMSRQQRRKIQREQKKEMREIAKDIAHKLNESEE